jgi:hypothetical protein
MTRLLVRSSAVVVALLLASVAHADVASSSTGCGGHPSHNYPPACNATAQTSAYQTCQECQSADTVCLSALLQAGFEKACVDARVGGDVEVLCKPTASASRRGVTVPLAGLLLAASIFATVRLRRRG